MQSTQALCTPHGGAPQHTPSNHKNKGKAGWAVNKQHLGVDQRTKRGKIYTAGKSQASEGTKEGRKEGGKANGRKGRL